MGKWKISACDWRIVEDASGNVVADVRAPYSNSDLIAAAPEMAELLALVVDGAEAMGWDVGPKIRALLSRIGGDK